MAAEFSTKLTQPASPEEFADELANTCRTAGFSHYMAIRFGDERLTTILHVVQNAPPQSEAQLKDAQHWTVARLIESVRNTPLPVHYGEGMHPGLELPGYRSGIAATARSARSGILLTFASDAPALDKSRLLATTGHVLLTATLCIPGMSTFSVQPCPFSQQELACLRYHAASLSSKATALKLGISFRTVQHHLESIRKRCGVKTSMAAVHYARERGWLEWPAHGASESTG